EAANNPYQKKPPEKAPPNTKLVDKQNAINSGKFDKKQPPIPGNSAPKTKSGSRNQKAQKPSKTSPYNNPQAAPQQQKAPPKRFFPKMRSESNQSSDKTPLPKFTPKAADKPILTSSNSSYSVPAQPIGGFKSSASSSSAPVLPSNAGSYRTGDGFANTNPNNNPNGPVTVAARREVNYGPYMADIERRIRQAWRSIDRVEDNKVIIVFKVARNGSLITNSLRTVRATSAEAEASARQAIFNASPGFRPLPPGSPESIPIEFTFTNNLQDINSSVSSSY
ncbi:MAG TPA: TonB C-terminal domain-containing protein, partial [Vampirovibrionales bacterium]